MAQLTVSGNDEGMRLERFVQKHFPQIPRPVRQKLFRQKKIAVFRNKKREKPETSFLLQKNDEIKIFIDLENFGEVKKEPEKNFDFVLKNPKFQNVEILFEDENFFVVSKPAGIAVHPGSKVQFGHSLIDFFIAKVRQNNPNAPEPKLVHRLDKDTSGVVMITKNDAFLRKLTQMIREGNIEKNYYAVVKGKLLQKKGTICLALERQENNKLGKIFVSQDGKNSVTHFEEEKFLTHCNATLVKIGLETGRMHQIRVHFAAQNNPLAGDALYGDFAWNRELEKKWGLKRQCLHAFEISFLHPDTKKKVHFSAPLPSDFIRMVHNS